MGQLVQAHGGPGRLTGHLLQEGRRQEWDRYACRFQPIQADVDAYLWTIVMLFEEVNPNAGLVQALERVWPTPGAGPVDAAPGTEEAHPPSLTQVLIWSVNRTGRPYSSDIAGDDTPTH